MDQESSFRKQGVWERQIRSIRNVMNGIIREHGTYIDEEVLRTFLCEAQATVNNRPLTLETLSDPLSEPPISPSMLLTGKTRLVLPPPGEFKREDIYCKRKWRRTQHLQFKNFGKDGAKNTCNNCRRETSGYSHEETSKPETLFC